MNRYQFACTGLKGTSGTEVVDLEEGDVLEGYLLENADSRYCLLMEIDTPEVTGERYWRDWDETNGIDFSYAADVTGDYSLRLTCDCDESFDVSLVYWVNH